MSSLNTGQTRECGMLREMKREDTPKERRRFTGTNLVREISYMHEDEAEALDLRAKKERASKSEIIRRAVRAYLGIEE
jgi:Ribbon-helix-helix protein, copG family